MTDGVAAAVVLAGGSGSRVGAGRNKVYLSLAGRPVLAWSLTTFAAMPEIGPIVLVVRPDDRAAAATMLDSGPLADVQVVDGGATRQESELRGLQVLADRIAAGAVDAVLVHDGARPLLTEELTRTVLGAARTHGGAVPGLPRDDLATVELATESVSLGSTIVSLGSTMGERLTGPAPPGAVAVQTPQGFRAAPLLAACTAAAIHGFAATDTASCVERFGTLPIRWVPGDERNIKVTYPHDLRVAEHLLAR